MKQQTAPDHRMPNTPAVWKGIVVIERPDLTKLSQDEQPMVWVKSARLIEHGGLRAICTRVPYAMVAHYFRAEDPDFVPVYAELSGVDRPEGGHLEFYERASHRDFFTHPEQLTPAH